MDTSPEVCSTTSGCNPEAKLRESFKRCSPETVEAIVRFHEQRYLKLPPGEGLAQRADSTRLAEDLGIDSLTMLEIVMSIEEALDFRIEDAEARQIRTLGDVRQYVDDRVHGRPVSLARVEAYDRERICLILPQQPPFLFMDQAEIDGDTVRASYVFREEELFFPGHFRNEPVVPASIVYEALGQAACLWVLERAPSRLHQVLTTNQILFVGMDEARFFKRAKPGDKIEMKLTLAKLRAPLAVFDGEAHVGESLLARVEGLKLAFGEFDPTSFDAAPAAVPATAPTDGTDK
jgi:acyl carrier protein